VNGERRTVNVNVPGSLNRPEGKFLAGIQTGILQIDQIKATLVTRTDKRLVFAENKGLERTSIFRQGNSNDDVELVSLSIDSKNFCWNRGH
jgi:hypothetical protein